jgi:NAD(P)-dependent dehydrogenase (short-subunit alcohol dehydrogenase family)
VAFTYSLAQSPEVLEKNIRVNAVAPGHTWAPLVEATYPGEQRAGQTKSDAMLRTAVTLARPHRRREDAQLRQGDAHEAPGAAARGACRHRGNCAYAPHRDGSAPPPPQIAPSYVFLASEIDSSYMSGQARLAAASAVSRASVRSASWSEQRCAAQVLHPNGGMIVHG